MNKQLITRTFISAASLLLLAGCGATNEPQTGEEESGQSQVQESSSASESSTQSDSGMGDMKHDESGELPEGIKEAENPKYAIREEVSLQTDHMDGMNGAQGKVVGAYDTAAYEVTYTPTNNGETVENHKWVVQEEIADSGDELLEPGTEVTLEAFHMEGMKGAEATIDFANDSVVYMVDYQPTSGGHVVKNHKWVTEDELAPAE